MFIDRVTFTLSAGKGGNGVVAWRREKYIPKGGPTGGNGGKGASITLRAESQISSLEGLRNKRIIQAEHGLPGGSSLKQGRAGKDLILSVPCGTLVKDAHSKEVLYDLTEEGQECLLCKGGKGGKGNAHFKSPTHQAPTTFTEGTPGERKEIELELKLIADVGLVGMPNAGKSTLMKGITHVPVKIAAYPFTTLFPNLGFHRCEDRSKILIADIPGIIKNAHQNKGLGFAFLKHIERTSVLVYIIDGSGFEGRDPWEDFSTLLEEVKAYKNEMLEKPFFVVLNKMDMEGAEEYVAAFKAKFPYDPSQLFPISAIENIGIDALMQALEKILCKQQLLPAV